MSLIKRLFVWLAGLIIGFCLILLIGFISYYFVEILPHRDEMNAAAEKYSGNKSDELLLQAMVRKANPPSANLWGSSSRTSYAVRNLSFKYLEGKHLNGLRRGVREVIWNWWLDILYSEEQIDSIWLNEAYFGNTKTQSPIFGIDRAASEVIGIPLSDLKCEQMALLVAITWSPTMSKTHPEIFKNRVERIALVCNSR